MSNNPTHESLVFAVFDQEEQAVQAVEALHDKGFTTDQIRFSKQFTREDFYTAIKDMLVFPDERQDETESDIHTMLRNMGLSEEEIQFYDDAFAKGAFVVIVRPDNVSRDVVEGILRDNHGYGYRGK